MLHMSKLPCFIWQSCHVAYDKVVMLHMTKFPCYIRQSLHVIYVKVVMLHTIKLPCFIWQSFHVTNDKVSLLHMTKFSCYMVTWQNGHLANSHLTKWSPSKRKCLIPAMVSDTEYQRENNFILYSTKDTDTCLTQRLKL